MLVVAGRLLWPVSDRAASADRSSPSPANEVSSMERCRITPNAAVYFVTFSIVEWLPVFVAEASCRVITDSLNFATSKKCLVPTPSSSCRPTCTQSCSTASSTTNDRNTRSPISAISPAARSAIFATPTCPAASVKLSGRDLVKIGSVNSGSRVAVRKCSSPRVSGNKS